MLLELAPQHPCYSLELTKVLLQKPLQNSCTTHQGNAEVYCHSSLITYMGVDQIFYQLLNQLAIVFFFPTHIHTGANSSSKIDCLSLRVAFIL
jgi:hypothetical protein